MYKLTSEMQLKPVDITSDDVTQFSDGAIVINTDGIIYRAESTTYTVLLDPTTIGDLSDYYTKGQVDGFLGPINSTNQTQTTQISGLSTDVGDLETQLGDAAPALVDISQTANAAYSASSTNTSDITTIEGNISSLNNKTKSRGTWELYDDGHKYTATNPTDIKNNSNIIASNYMSTTSGTLLSKGYEYDHHFGYVDIIAYNQQVNPEVLYFPNAQLSADIQNGLKPNFSCTLYNQNAGASVKLNDTSGVKFRLLSDSAQADQTQFYMNASTTWKITYCVSQVTQEAPLGGTITVEVPVWLVYQIN